MNLYNMSKSDETRIELLEQNHNTIMKLFDEYREDNKTQHEEIKEMILEIKQDLKISLDNKADKWVQEVIKWLGIFIGGGVLTYLGSLIIKVINL